MSKHAWLALSVFLVPLIAQAAEEPQWLKDARAREGKIGKAVAIQSSDKWFTAKVPAKLVGTIEKVDGSYTVELNIGSEQPVYCEVVPDGFDLADMVRRTFDLTMEEVGKAQGKVEARLLEETDAGVFGSVPYLQTQWVYRVNDGTAPRVGGYKQISMEKNGQGIYCAHVDIGYNKSFVAMAKAFAETFSSTSGEPAPYYEEIAVTTINGKRVGIARSSLVRDADGDTEVRDSMASLIPGPSGSLHSQDVTRLEWVRPDNSLINATRIVAEDGKLTTNLNLKVVDDQWKVEGDHGGKKIDEKLNTDAQPGSWLAQASGIRKILTAANPVGTEYSMWYWLGSEPTKLTETKARVTAKAGDKRFKGVATLDGLNADVVMDATTGTIVNAQVKTNGMEMNFERVYAKGAL
jgi:hypothetical protein